MLNDILTLDQQWLPNRSDFPSISWPSPNYEWFPWSIFNGCSSQQGTLTFPTTWFRPPFWDLLVLQLLRPDSTNLPCLYSTFRLEYPLVLSRFCFIRGHFHDIRERDRLSNIHCREYMFVAYIVYIKRGLETGCEYT